MRSVVLRVLVFLLFPLRIFGYATDIYTLWTNRDVILSIATSRVGSGISVVVAASQGYGIFGVGLSAVGGLFFALWLIATGIEWHRRRQAKAELRRSALETRIRDLETQVAARPLTEEEQLKQRCLRLGTELNQLTEQWLAEYRKVQEREPTTAQQRMLKGRDTEVVLERARLKYDKSFRDKAMRLFELAEERGLTERQWKHFAYNAAGDLRRMQMVAERLLQIGHDP